MSITYLSSWIHNQLPVSRTLAGLICVASVLHLIPNTQKEQYTFAERINSLQRNGVVLKCWDWESQLYRMLYKSLRETQWGVMEHLHPLILQGHLFYYQVWGVMLTLRCWQHDVFWLSHIVLPERCFLASLSEEGILENIFSKLEDWGHLHPRNFRSTRDVTFTSRSHLELLERIPHKNGLMEHS